MLKKFIQFAGRLGIPAIAYTAGIYKEYVKEIHINKNFNVS